METTNNIKDYEDYIGEQVIGFKFDSLKTCTYSAYMNDYIGVVGTIVDWDSDYDVYEVEFEDGVIWYYPAELVIKQLEQKEELVEMMEEDGEDGLYDDDSVQDMVNNPSHYQLKSGVQVIDIIEGAGLGFHLANVIKYVLRAGKKDPSKELEDLKKAEYYLHRKIKQLEDDEK